MTNTWYRVKIIFDCNAEKVNIHVYDNGDILIGNRTDINFHDPQSCFYRVQLVAGAGGDWTTTSYWDDIAIYEPMTNGELISETIELPQGMKWATFRAEYDLSVYSSIKFSILDENDEILVENIYTDELDLVDKLSDANDRIKLRAQLYTPSYRGARLSYWAVEWKREDVYYDSLFPSFKVSEFQRTEVVEGKVQLESGKLDGYILSKPISVPTGNFWGSLYYNVTYTKFSVIYFDIIDHDTGEPVPGYDSIHSQPANLYSIDPRIHSTVQIRGRIYKENEDPLNIDFWGIDFIPNNLPRISNVDHPDEIFRTQTGRISVNCTDKDQEEGTLDVSIYYRESIYEPWKINYLSKVRFNYTRSFWEVDFTPPSDAEIGLYSIKVIVIDTFDNKSVLELTEVMDVKNNVPTDPIAYIEPDRIFTDTSTNGMLGTISYDLEGETVLYHYQWYVNNISIYGSQGWTEDPNMEVGLPSEETRKGDLITFEVYATDGIDETNRSMVSRRVLNSKPLLLDDITDYITIEEDSDLHIDMKDYFYDPDGDELIYSVMPNSNFTWTLENQHLIMTPNENITGIYKIGLTADDGSETGSLELTVHITPINDPPVGKVISPMGGEEYNVSDPVLFLAEIWDIDTDRGSVKVTWSIGDAICKNNNYTRKFTAPGQVNITCRIYDGEYEVLIGDFSVMIVEIEFNGTENETDGKENETEKNNTEGGGDKDDKGKEELNWLAILAIVILCLLSLIIIILIFFLVSLNRRVKEVTEVEPTPVQDPIIHQGELYPEDYRYSEAYSELNRY